EQIQAVTGREGVDVVLNSLPGEAIPASLSLLRSYGRFLEIGKIDIYQNRKIGLLPFQDNLSYFAIDLDRMLRQRPEAVQSLFAEVMDHFARGTYRPLPFTEFDADDVSGALRYMAQRKNIGKVVVSLESQSEQPVDNTDASDDAEPLSLRGDGTYLVTGGLGALGLQVAQWLVTKGARHIAILSRRAPSADVQKLLDALAITGATVLTLRGDVADSASLRAALDTIPDNFPPLRGVIHAAGVLDDGVLFDMSVERFDRVLAPKVDGAWNLHTATLDSPLDFFVLFSSVACVLGSPGQGNYAAGNAFLDALAVHRRFRGLPATSVNWGPWAGAGMAAKLDQNDARQGRGMLPIEPSPALEVLESLVAGGPANVMVANVRWTELLRMLPGRKPSILADIATEGEAPQNNASSVADLEFRRQLSEADFDTRVTMLRDCLAGELARIMAIDVANLDLDQPLNTIGLDSLMAMELKVVLESRLGFSLPMARFFENPSVASLAVDAAKLVDAGVTPAPGSAAAARAAANGQATTPIAWNPLMQLEGGGAGTPVFCLHPFGGDVRCYFELARHLGEDRPVYAVTARGLSGVHEPHRSMEAMIADYAEAIRKVQPQGPYNLVGWSMGGIYAHALAYYLVQQGDRIGALALLDTPLPSLLEDSEFDDATRFVCDYVDFCNR
ncbi:MAG TPA: SDR family NAD(P)-dependent oxidoreductase, partial [Pirellulales bacterium]|nr:SDR family NAD(P)-dependent oxidoreductase [Pirellulales bacterium]